MITDFCLSWPVGRAAQRETKKKKEGVDGEAGGGEEEQKAEDKVDEEEEEEKEEEKVIFVHYEQRKVMLSQLHPIENGVPDPKSDPPSELRQVRDREEAGNQSAGSHFN